MQLNLTAHAALLPLPPSFPPPDLARDIRDTKLEARAPAEFVEAGHEGGDDDEDAQGEAAPPEEAVAVTVAPASAPASPARSRRRGFTSASTWHMV